VPGTPERNDPTHHPASVRPRHPAALLAFALAAGAGISFARAPILHAITALAFAALALKAEGKRPRHELPFLALAAVLFLAHAIFYRFEPRATIAAALLALRLLALVYLTRWAVKTFLPGAAQWLLEQPMPTRPRPLALAMESARLSTALLPLAVREAEAQTLALKARGIRSGRGLTGRARFTAAWLLPFLGSMLRVGDALADALHARGYTPGKRRVGLARASWTLADAGVIVLGIAIAGALYRGF
jgi:energy-coupling factor transporter transmembrane protein EcfT